MWQFSTGLTYSLFLQPPSLRYTDKCYTKNYISTSIPGHITTGRVSSLCKVWKIQSSYVHSYFMVVSTSLALLADGLIALTVHTFNYILYALFLFSMLAYICGRVFFRANVLQLELISFVMLPHAILFSF